jgi:protein-disulfide isomerase
MSSVKKTGNPSVRPVVRVQKPQPKAIVARRKQPATVPWYFWAVLAAVVVLGVVVVGTILGPSSPASVPSNQQAGLNSSTSDLLTNGFGEGNPNAAVKIVEFGDFQCPACQYFFSTTYQQLKQAYIDTGKIYYYYKPYPLTSLHPKAMKAAELAICAANGDASKFFAIHDLLLTNQNAWVNGDENTIWPQYVLQVGLDPTAVMSCVAKDTYSGMVNANISQAIALKVPGTPTLYLNGQSLQALTFDALKPVLDAALKK